MSSYVATPRSGWQPCLAAISRAASMSSTEKATRCMPISLGRVGSVSIAPGWMYSKSSRRPLPSGVWSIAMLAWLPSRPTAVSVHSPLTVSRPRTVSPRSVEKAIAASRSRTAMPTFSSLMRMRCTLPSQGDVSRSVSWQFRLSRTGNCPAAVPRADGHPDATPGRAARPRRAKHGASWSSEHRVVVGARLRERLENVPVFDDLAVLKPEEVGGHRAGVLGRGLDQAVGNDDVALADHMLDLDV